MLKKDDTQNEDNILKNAEPFVVIVPRVSTEAQGEKGSSLKVQTEAMEDAVAKNGGKIVANYGGLEHSTPDFEHTKMEQLVRESYLPFGKRKWNAVMFYDHSRWSRDNNKASDYIEILKRNKIRFFTVSQEWILTNPEHRLILGINTVTNEYQAMVGIEKSLKSRIARARDGKFTAGQPPFGRERDKETGKLRIIEKDKRLIETAARLYLEECKGFIKIGKILKKPPSVIQRALLYNAGDTYIQNFKCERLGIDESIPTKIPPTLDDLTWRLIKEEAEKRRKYHPGIVKNERLLSGYLNCDDCGKGLSLQVQKTRKNGKTYTHIYYRHPSFRTREEVRAQIKRLKREKYPPSHWLFNEKVLTGRCFSMVKAELIEDLVMKSLIEILKNSKKFKEAVLKPHPSEKEKKALEHELLVLDDSIKKIEKKETNLIYKMEQGIKVNGLQERADKHSRDKKELLQRVDKIKKRLSDLPKEKEIKAYRKLLLKQIEKLDLDNLSFKEKRELIKMFCCGRDMFDDRPAGIYVSESDDRHELSFYFDGLFGGSLGYISDNDPDLDILVDKKTINTEELRSDSLTNSFKGYMGIN